jgi:uncharacterized protein (DUF305 family)
MTQSNTKTLSRLNQAGLWIRLALIVIFALWLIFGVRPAQRFPSEGSSEVTFARDMMAHHAQAVEMAILLRDRIGDPELRTFTLDIALTQQAQIGQMQGWLAVWNVPLAGVEPPMQGMGEQMGMATREELNEVGTLPVSEAEVKFLQLMIRHHQGGVMMAEDVLSKSQREEVRTLATSIVKGQTSEIDYMTDLLTVRDAEPPSPLAPMNHSQHTSE